mgnify:FL=1
MHNSIENQVALITGAGSGIGAETARMMGRDGMRVCLAGIPAQGVNEVAAQIAEAGGQSLAVSTDVAEAASVKAAVSRTVEEFGQLDVAVANAGVQLHQDDRCLHTMSDEAWDRTNNVNYRGVYLTCKMALAQMVEQETGGCIIIVASIAALSGVAENPAYTASKHGLIGLGRHIAVHYAKHNIRCNVICPGALEHTPNHEDHPDPEGRRNARIDRIPMQRLGTPAEIASWILFLSSPAASYANGAIIPVDGGFSAM